MGALRSIKSNEFKTVVTNSSVPVLVDFWAEWCGPCRAIAPVLDEIQNQFEGSIEIVKVNVDDESRVAAEYGVSSIPTLLLFVDGVAVKSIVGAKSKQSLLADLAEWI